LRVDALKWVASKLAPRKYGDRLEHDHKGGLDFRPAILIQVGDGPRQEPVEVSGKVIEAAASFVVSCAHWPTELLSKVWAWRALDAAP